MWLDYPSIALFALSLVGIAVYARKRAGSVDDFLLALKAGVGCSPLIGTVCMAMSLLLTVTVSLLTKRPSDAANYEAFDKPIENEIK